MHSSRAARTNETTALARSDWALALLIGGLSLALYVLTACRSIFVGDSAEIAGAVSTFGVPHPPGYPLFTSLSGVLVNLIPGLEPAFRVNLLVGFYGAFAVTLLVLLARRLGTSKAASIFAACSLATGSTFWSQCVAAEVYSFDVLLFFASLHGLLNVARSPSQPRAWIAPGLVFGLWLGHRALNVVFIPSMLWFLVAVLGSQSIRRNLRGLLSASLATLAGGLVPLIYLMLASRLDPLIDIGDPETPERLWDVVRGTPYARHLTDGSTSRSLHRLASFATTSIGGSQLGLGFHAALWAIAHAVWKRAASRSLVFSLTSLIALDLAFASRYSVLDIEVFFLPAWSACALLAAFGFDSLQRKIPSRLRSALATLLILLTVLIPFSQNYATNDLSRHKLTRLFADSLFESLPRDAILLVNGDTSIHSTWYLQAVEKVRPDVAVLSLGHAVPWHVEQLQHRHPAVQWPSLRAGGLPSEYARELMLENIESRPICISPAIDATTIIRPTESRAFELFTRGLVRQVYYTGQSFDLRERITWNLDLFERIQEQLRPLPEHPDMDSRSTLLQFSLCLYLSAQRAQQAGWIELERKALEACLFYTPDVHERAIHEDVQSGLGIRTPLNQFGRQARERLLELPAPDEATPQQG